MTLLKQTTRNALSVLKPPARLPLDQWIESNLRLPADVSALPGRVTLWPFQRDMAHSIGDPDVERVTVVKSVRVGFSTLLTATIGSYVANEPSPILLLMPTEADCRDVVVSDLEPIFEATPELNGLLADERTAQGRSTMLSRRFPGGSLKVIAAKAPRNLRRHNVRVLLIDEADAMESSQEGSPIVLAERRTLSFPNRKIVLGSTPIWDHGHVLTSYRQSDQRIFEVPCPECHAFNEIKWADIQWPEGQPHKAAYCCPSCGSIIDETHKLPMVQQGRWRATRPEIVNHHGYRLNALVSPHTAASWANLATEFVEAKKDPTTLQVFVNTILAEGWREEGDELDQAALTTRREPFSLRAIPPDVLMLTAGVDCQDDRLEAVVIGHGKDGAAFVLSHQVLWGAIASGDVWQELEDLLRATYQHPNGGMLRIDAAVIDSSDGDHQPHVYAFTRPRMGRRVVAGKGVAGFSRAPIQRSTSKGVSLFLVGVDAVKQNLFNRLAGGGSIKFSEDLEPIYFEQLTSERRVVRYVKGSPQRRFERIPGMRAETLDATVYAFAARHLVNMDLSRRESELASVQPPAAIPAVVRSAWMSGTRSI
ncbi:MAG TPA: phage terminase large subunit family protein [Hyphomicrobium sp.]|nr:phage terminase large subunit family protein [Hyphomicrobium sp.]